MILYLPSLLSSRRTAELGMHYRVYLALLEYSCIMHYDCAVEIIWLFVFLSSRPNG